MSTWVLVGTLPGGAGGVANFLSKVTFGVSQSVVGDLGKFRLTAGLSLSESPKKVTIPQTAAVSITQLVSGTQAKTILTPGVILSLKASGGSTPAQAVGAELVRISYDLTQTTYAISAVSTGTWTNPNNGNGANNSTFATNANSVTVAASGLATYSYAAQINKTDLTISSVKIQTYWQYVAGFTAPGTWRIEYSFDGTNYVLLNQGSTAFDSRTIPTEFILTEPVGQDWTKLSNLRVRYTHTASPSATPSTLSVDATKLIVFASRIDTL